MLMFMEAMPGARWLCHSYSHDSHLTLAMTL